MDQLARLGVVFDSEGAQQLIKSLKDVQANSKGAEAATENLGKATGDASKNFKVYSGSVNDANAHMKAYADHLNKVKVANDNATKSSRALSAAGLNLSRQFSDVGVSLAGGINPLMVLIQQGPQIADGFQVASAAGLSFKGVLTGLWAQLAPLLTAFAPWIAGLAAVGGGIWYVVHATEEHNKQIAELNKKINTQYDLLQKNVPFLFETANNANLAADGQKNFEAWLQKANVPLAEQNRLLRANALNKMNAASLDAAANVTAAQAEVDRLNKAGRFNTSIGGFSTNVGGFGTISAPSSPNTESKEYRAAIETLRRAKAVADQTSGLLFKALAPTTPDAAFGDPLPKGRKPPKDTQKEIAEARARADGRYASSGAVTRDVSSIAVQTVDDYHPFLARTKEGGDRTIGGDPMVQSAEEASKALADIQKKRASDRVEIEKSMWGSLTALSSSGNKKLAAIGKAAAISQATIDGILAVQKALAAFPPPFNIAAAALVGGLAAVNVAHIAGVKGFAAGGYTGDGDIGQIAGVTHGKEFVVNAAATRRNRDTLEAMNAGRAIPKNPSTANGNTRGSTTVIHAPTYSMGSGNFVTEKVFADFDRKRQQDRDEFERSVPAIVAKHQAQKG